MRKGGKISKKKLVLLTVTFTIVILSFQLVAATAWTADTEFLC